MKPYLHVAGKGFHFQWNVDCSVGKNAANTLAADISYLQWYYTLAATHPLTPEDRKAIYRKVKITGVCKGTDDDPLVAAIVAQQKALNHPQMDGKVSVAHGTGKIGDVAFFILRLGARFANMFPNAWPRLDLIHNCPPLVVQAVRASVPSIPTS